MSGKSLTRDYFLAHLENMVAEGQAALKFGIDVSPAQLVAATESTLLDIIRTSFPLERLIQTSDLVFHAEGPAVRDDAPSLSAFNWLSGAAERSLRKLAGEMFGLHDRDARALRQALDLRLTGMAPGSLYLGFALAAPQPDMITAADEPVFATLREAFRTLPELTEAIGDDAVTPMAAEIIPDAAERDAALSTLHSLSPTGRRGIHTLDMTSPGHARGTLSQRERVVLADALRHPTLLNRKQGTFAGEVREIDLDRNRLHLRGIAGAGNLRCVLPALDRGQAKAVLGEFARVTGQYEADRSGRPRLLLVEKIEALPRASQAPLLETT